MAILEDGRAMYPTILYAYYHIHLQIETSITHFQMIIKEQHSRYVVYFYKKYHYAGHVFQGRDGDRLLIENAPYFLEASH